MSRKSVGEAIALWSPARRRAWIESLTPEERLAALYEWKRIWARPNQLPPAADWWTIWLFLGGRGVGKTRTGAQWINGMAYGADEPEHYALVGRTPADVRDVMVEGPSGIIATSPPWFLPIYEPSKRRVTWPNGCWATAYSGAQPEGIRGGEHHAGWADEICAWQYPEESWDNLVLSTRVGESRLFASTTPKPRHRVLSKLLARERRPGNPKGDVGTVTVSRGTTYENLGNLSQLFIDEVVRPYEGTRKGAQELLGQLMDDMEGALWTRDMLEATRVRRPPKRLVRIVVGVDPPGGTVTECGIVVAGLGDDGHVYVLADDSISGTPEKWGSQAVAAFYRWKADRMVGEQNFGGEMVKFTIRTCDPDRGVAYKDVHASRGKAIRAEPVAALSERGELHMVGMHAALEDELCNWVPDSGAQSPNRLDALVWAVTELKWGGRPRATGPVVAGDTARTSEWEIEQ